jgi:ABC-type Fe3+ transport system substrate-binding protein
MKNAPHPNAARVYINWLLSPAGQTAWATITSNNSRRLDVPIGDPERHAVPDVDYPYLNHERYEPDRVRAAAIAREVVK